MDLLALLEDPTDDESDSGEASISETTKAKRAIHASTTNACESTSKRDNKIRRKGRIDILSSNKAKDSEIFSRSVPHRRGHWAGHVKIPIVTKSLRNQDDSVSFWLQRKSDSVKCFRNLLERRGISGTMVEHEYLHLSLSKQFSLQVAQIESFVRQLSNLVGQEHATSLSIDCPSASELRSLWKNGRIDQTILLNDEKTRSFFCWEVRPNVTLQRIVAHIDTVMKSYKQPVYYQPAKFHISIASFPGNLLQQLDSVNNDAASVRKETPMGSDVPEEDEDDDSSSSSESTSSESCFVPVRELLCTMGTTKEYLIPLRESKRV